MQDYFTTGGVRIGKCIYTRIVMEVVTNGIFIHAMEINGAVENEKEQLLRCRGEYRTLGDFLKKVNEISNKTVNKY